MPLTEQQIQNLFDFTQKKLVCWYDLQVELADHLASSIEEIMNADPAISFQQALQKVYAGFGIFGFAHVMQERQTALEKQHRKRWKQSVKAFFSLPKIAFTILLFISAFSIAPLLQAETKRWIIYALIISGAITGAVRNIKNNKVEIKKLLLTKSSHPLIFTFKVLPFFAGITNAQKPVTNSIVFACLVTIILIVQLAFNQVYRQIQTEAMELYPQAFAIAYNKI